MMDVMRARRTVRNFSDRPLPPMAESALKNWRMWVEPMNDRRTIDNHIRRLPGFVRLEGSGIIPAREYLLYMSQDKPMALFKAGYIMEQIALKLSQLGVGSCFLSSARAGAHDLGTHKLEQKMIMALGVPAHGEPNRQKGEIQRKPLSDIMTGEACDDLLTALDLARLAPSHKNAQPWYFIVSGRDVHCCIADSDEPRERELNEFDTGAAISHLRIAMSEMGHESELLWLALQPEGIPQGYSYYITLRVEDVAWQNS